MSTRTLPDILVVEERARHEAERGDPPPESATAPERMPQILRRAVDDLLALFDGAAQDLNSTRAGTNRIALCRQGLERRYCLGDPAASDRFVALFLCVPAHDGHIFGGAFVNSSRTLPSIYLVPYRVGGKARWTVSATGAPFAEQTVRDLFAAVFEDDQQAVERLTPLVGYDLFQLPWS